MNYLKKIISLTVALAMTGLFSNQLEAVSYVTDTGGYAYDESRAATNIAPAIALGTVAIIAVIAIAVQNSHDSSSVHGHFFSSSSSSSRSSSSSSSSFVH
jgi:hypothetical protein